MPLSAEQWRRRTGFSGSTGIHPTARTARCTDGKAVKRWSPSRLWMREATRSWNATVLMVQFFCNNCGHITLFNAKRIGLFSS